MTARIYRPAKGAMQSGFKGSNTWVLEYAPAQKKRLDGLMGWTGSGDMSGQVHLKFTNCDDAVAYAKRNDLDYIISQPHERRPRIRSYADSFAYRG